MNQQNDAFTPALFAALADAGDRVVIEIGQRVLSGHELAKAVERWAAALAAVGIVQGDRIAVQAEKSLELVLLYLATLRLGAVYLPLNTGYRRDEIAYFIADAEPRLLICDPSAAEACAGLGPIVLTLSSDGSGTIADRVTQGHPPAPPHIPQGSDLAAIVYTSGTTGRPKGAMISQHNLLANARALIAGWGLCAQDVLLHALPLYHIHGLFVALNTLLLAGGRIVLLPAFDTAAVFDRLAGATVFMGVPTYYTRLLADPALNVQSAQNVRLFVCGSAPLNVATFADFELRTGHRILERYGMSECGIICSNPLNGLRIPGAVGRPVPGCRVRIADGLALGVLEVAGDSVFAGYWRNPEKTRQEFRDDGYFITGDIARIDGDGVVWIVGRDKDMIISGGLNVYPKEIEVLIDALDGVEESAVIGLPHDDFGEAVAAVVCLRDGAEFTAEAIIAALRGQLAGFKLPKAVFVVDELPRNAMGKVQKVELRKRHSDYFGTSGLA